MSWLFSKALCESLPSSQALVAEYSEATFLDGEQSAQWNVMPTPQGFWRNDKMMDALRLSQFGQTLKLLTEQDGEAVLMSFLAAFPAKTYPLPAEAQGLKEREADCGQNLRGSFAKYDPATSLWKTAQCSLLEDLEQFSETWPRWGSMHGGECWEQPTVALRINEKESGLWPTPTAQDNNQVRGQGAAANHPSRGTTLGGAVRNWPTPQASDNRDRGNLSSGAVKRRKEKGKQLGLSQVVSAENGRLNPDWVEWLMGWPIGLTDLKPLAMDKFQEWQQQHSESYQGSDAA